jgi:thiamine-phosphate pyrophosphorylase
VLRYYITDRHGAGGAAPLLRYVEAALRNGVDLLQVREKDLSARELLALVERIVELAKPFTTQILVNTRADIAIAAGAHGVHLPAASLSPRILRRIAPSGFRIGVSTHTLAEIQTAQSESADFVVYGPIFPTASKSGCLGLDALRQAVRLSTIPILALGGITAANAQSCLDAGAAGIAGISLFQS